MHEYAPTVDMKNSSTVGCKQTHDSTFQNSTPAESQFTMGKGLKEFQLCDSRRLRKKPQAAQDDVTELFDLFDAHFWGWKGI
jgi:hypothetical protein